MMKYKYIKTLGLIAVLIFVAYKLHLDNNKTLLNFVAKHLFFDQEYYLATYKEVREQNIDPFEHFTKHGWKEGKNPNKDFDVVFYQKFNFRNNIFNLNPIQHYARAKLLLQNIYTKADQLKMVDKLLDKPKYYIALVAPFRNEDRFLKEWIEYHKMLGVEHFYLFNHLSTDNYKQVLEPYIKSGLVDLYDLTQDAKTLKAWNIIQTDAYTKIAHEVKDIVEWLVVIDTDEFIVPLVDKDLPTMLKKYDKYASLSVNWRIFGTNNIQRIPDDKLLIETILYSSNKPDFHVKTIVKPRFVYRYSNPHFADLIDGYGQVTEDYEYFRGSLIPHESRNVVRLNHYWSRDNEFFENTKLKRVHMVEKILSDQEKQNQIDKLKKENQEASAAYDNSILKFAPDLRSIMGFSRP